MPHLIINGARLHYEAAGTGADAILFIHGLMLASEGWQAQRDHFAVTHRVITFDLRGQGRSDHSKDRLDLDSLAEDTADLIEALQLGRCHVVGFSMGAFIGLRLAARWPERVRSLLLIGPSADAEEAGNRPRYAAMIAFVALFGPRLIAGRLMRILFGDSFLRDPARAPARRAWQAKVAGLPRSIVRAASASARRKGIADELSRITAPTLVISGTEDRPVSPLQAKSVAAAIAGAVFMPIEKTGHAVMLEQPALFNTILRDWLLFSADGD